VGPRLEEIPVAKHGFGWAYFHNTHMFNDPAKDPLRIIIETEGTA